MLTRDKKLRLKTSEAERRPRADRVSDVKTNASTAAATDAAVQAITDASI